MKFKYLIILTFICVGSNSYAQKDTIRTHGFVTTQGIFQTGNLNQVGGNAITRLNIANSKNSLEFSLQYNYVLINGSVPVNDFWSFADYKLGYNKKVYPIIIGYYGFAKSVGIDNSIVAGIGLGSSIIKKSPKQFLKINAFGGYMQFDYIIRSTISEALLGTYFVGATPIIKDKINLNWEFHSYFAPLQTDFYGFQNIVRLELPISKKVNISLSHVTVYGNVVDNFKTKLNTTMLVGVSSRF